MSVFWPGNSKPAVQTAPPDPPPLASRSSSRMLFTFSTVAQLFLKLRRHTTAEPFEDSNDEASPESQAPSLSSAIPSIVPSSTPQVHSPSTATTTPSTPNQKHVDRRFSQDTPVSHVKSSTFPGPPASLPSSPSHCHSSSAPSSVPASPSSPRSSTRSKPQRTQITSGRDPLSHPGLAETACERREAVERVDTYHCSGGVNLLILLRMTRAELMDTVSLLGANTLVEEQWKCTIYGPKNKATYKVQIHYKACGTRSTLPDPHQPVAVDQMHSIPGLMTILRRNDD